MANLTPFGNTSSMAGNASSFGGSSFGLETTWGQSPNLSGASPGNSFVSHQQFSTSQPFPTSSPFPGFSPAQSFPASGLSGIMTPSPSMPVMSSFSSSPFASQNLNTGFLSTSSSQNFSNNNNEVGGKYLTPNKGFQAGFGNGGTGAPGLTTGTNPDNDPFGGLL